MGEFLIEIAVRELVHDIDRFASARGTRDQEMGVLLNRQIEEVAISHGVNGRHHQILVLRFRGRGVVAHELNPTVPGQFLLS